LIIGGGDGLALREVLKWQPKTVTLIDLDPDLVALFKMPEKNLPGYLANKVKLLTENSFNDKRVTVIHDDAFIAIDRLLQKKQLFDTIIVDLPDPSHPDLNKLYSVNFYYRLNHLLSMDGAFVVQSTSPFHAKNAFISIAKTVQQAKFTQVEQYHQNVPSFGEWGWTIATKAGAAVSQRLQKVEQLGVATRWLTMPLLHSAFVFNKGFYADKNSIKANYLGSNQLYQYHQQAWERETELSP
jgi:spermidine synthase